MAIIAVLFGGIVGFLSSLTALLAFDVSFLAACGVYMFCGSVVAVALIAVSMIPAQNSDPEAETA